jgi:peptidoglycan/LPS O-acetylase OafA/YrhL
MPSENKLPPGTVPAAIYVLQNALLLPGMLDITPIMTVAWSLSYEVFFYAAIPALVIVLRMHGWRRRARVAFFVAAAAGFTAGSWLGAAHLQLVMFVSGILVHELCQAQRARPWPPTVVRAVGAAGAVALALSLPVLWSACGAPWARSACGGGNYFARTLWLFGAFGAVVLAAFQRTGPVQRWCSATPLRWLGNMSYSYYLVHALVLKSVGLALKAAPALHRLPANAVYWAVMPLAFAATVVCSGVVFAAVERRFSLRTAPASAVPALAHAAIG